MFEDYTATQIVDELDQLKHYDPEFTGPLSLIDEAALRWTARFPQLGAAHWAFAQARGGHNLAAGRDNWTQILTAAKNLADAMRPLGDVRLKFCGARSVYGTCHGQVHDGPCPRANNHVSPEV